MISRRGFLGTSFLAATAAFPAFGQQPIPRLAWTSPTTPGDGSIFLGEFKTGLAELGYVDQRNLNIQTYWGEDSTGRIPALVKEVLASKPTIAVAYGQTAVALKQAAPDFPIVFAYSGDPIAAGLVDSMARPGGNATGISFLTLELVGKRMELVKEVLPKARSVAVIANPLHPGNPAELRTSETAAAALGLGMTYFEARNIPEQMQALAAIDAAPADAVMMFPVQNVIANRASIAQWAIKSRIPTISGWAQFAEGGNLMSYGPNLLTASRRLAAYVDSILKGTKPAGLPVELPSRIEFVINLQAAKSLAINISPSLLVRADRVIE